MWCSLEEWLSNPNRARTGGAEVLVNPLRGECLLRAVLCNHLIETLRKTCSREWKSYDSELEVLISAKAERVGGGDSPVFRESNSRNTILKGSICRGRVGHVGGPKKCAHGYDHSKHLRLSWLHDPNKPLVYSTTGHSLCKYFIQSTSLQSWHALCVFSTLFFILGCLLQEWACVFIPSYEYSTQTINKMRSLAGEDLN